MITLEHKSFDIEIKNIDEKGRFTAYASTFGNVDRVNDTVVKGAFTRTLENRNLKEIYMFWQHKTDVIIGEWLSMVEDEKGLLVEGQLFIKDIQQAQEAYFLMKQGLIAKLSIGFQLIKKSFEAGKRILEEIKLLEISPVTFPADEKADIMDVKNMKDLDIREFERKLRDECGLSQKEAKAVCAVGFKGLQRDDAELDEKKEDEAVWSEFVKTIKDYKL